jgi:hypothetical protein
MIREQTLRARQKLIGKLPITGELLRGSLLERTRWFRDGQKWRTGCEGRISVVKRRHGLDRCRYKGSVGMDRWVGLGVIADSVVNIGRAIEKQATP